MRVLKIAKGEWESGVKRLCAGEDKQGYRLFGPVKERDYHKFAELAEGRSPDMDYANTRLSPKNVVYPQSELLFSADLDPSAENHHVYTEIEKDYSPRAVLGIRPCDAKAFAIVRPNFDNREYKDPWWVRSWDAVTLVGLACDAPCGACFCTTAGTGPHDESAVDVLLVDAGDHYLAKVTSEKGESLVKQAGWREEAGEEALELLEAKKREAEAKIRSQVPTDKLADKVTLELFDAPFWEDIAFACINCGTCTYLCPTCWCFDIQDEVCGTQNVRMRNWDSCMYPLFTLHGSGHNPRPNKTARVRQRFMHKLKYYVDKYGDGIQCVGCGRCVVHCPVNIDIRRVCRIMNEYEAAPACAV